MHLFDSKTQDCKHFFDVECEETSDPSPSSGSSSSPGPLPSPGPTPLPDASSSPGPTPLPDASSSPGPTPLPDASSSPGLSPLPDASSSPGLSPLPDTSSSIGLSPLPDTSSSPGPLPPPDTPSSPGPTPLPDTSSSIGLSPLPDTSSSPGPLPPPDTSSSPGLSPLPDTSSSPGPTPAAYPSPLSPNGKPAFAVYLESKEDPEVSEAAGSIISNFPRYVTHLLFSSMRPDTTYAGGVTFKGTGLKFKSDAAVVKNAIALLKEKNPNTKVLLSVGGFDYDNWDGLNATGVASFVHTFGLDGVDIDYEPSTADCNLIEGRMRCDTDDDYINAIRALRAALPPPYILSNAVLHVGAYGEGKWADLEPKSQYTGLSINPLRDVGGKLDLLLLMAYNAGNSYDTSLALDASAEYFKGDILVGVQVGRESQGHLVTEIDKVDAMTKLVNKKKAAGVFLWSARRQAPLGYPTSNQISKRICNNLDLEGCDTQLAKQ